MKIAILDYGMGNIKSVERKIQQLGAEPIVTNDHSKIILADKIILPGVGHFGKAMENLEKDNLIDSLNEAVLVNKAPILGICLGMQLMTEYSEEGERNGLGWVKATVQKFNVKDTLRHKVPHTGWNRVTTLKESPLMSEITKDSEFYFVHEYHIVCDDKQDVLNETLYEYSFVSAFQKENIFGVQYHPEKSHDVGLQLFKNFINL